MAARKPKPWSVPPGLKIGIRISRGDVLLEAESTPAEALNVARMLTAMLRKLTAEAPDLLPLADSVPGGVMGYDWAEEFAEGSKPQRPPRVGY